MHIQDLSQWRAEFPALSRLAAALAHARSGALGTLAPGKHPVPGQDEKSLFVIIEEHGKGRTRDEARLEAHRRMVDLQVVLSGEEGFGWSPLSLLTQPEPFQTDRDVGFWKDRPLVWFNLKAGMAVLFRPEDAHAPLVGEGSFRKAVYKILPD